ncbi:MAG: zf-TFIIB domain-containing protein [Planctomycetota bacterium]
MADKAEVIKVEPTDDDPAIVNPLNDEPMEKLQIGNVKIDRCAKTGAIWLDRGELAQLALLDAKHKGLIKQLDKRKPDSDAARSRRGPLKSPRTGAVMMVVSDPEQKHIEFEVDPEGGGCFFDAGELADLTDYTFKERLRSLFG